MVVLGVILAISGLLVDGASGLTTAGITLILVGLVINVGLKRRVW